MNFTVRPAAQSDALAICALIQELARINGERSPLEPRFVEDYLKWPGCRVLLAESEGRVFGLLSYHIRPNLYHAGPASLIEELIVRAEMRGLGVGERLVRTAIADAREAGCTEISVSTMLENEDAQRFYRRLGLGDDALLLEMHFPDVRRV